MPPMIYQIAGGICILPAIGLLSLTILFSSVLRRRWMAILDRGAAALAIATIAMSAPAMPGWFVIAWAAVTAGWLGTGWSRSSIRFIGPAAAFLFTVAAGALEWSFERTSPLPPWHARTLCVVGDSVTAGLGRSGEITWPTLLRREHGVDVVDLSRAGCTVHQAVQIAVPVGREQGIVLLEIGGNDLIGRTDPGQFGSDLEALAGSVSGPERTVVMLELPRFPFDDAYGLQQRRVAKRYGMHLIPRRLFARILAGPGATSDGVHLSNAGQRALADLVWQTVGPAMGR